MFVPPMPKVVVPVGADYYQEVAPAAYRLPHDESFKICCSTWRAGERDVIERLEGRDMPPMDYRAYRYTSPMPAGRAWSPSEYDSVRTEATMTRGGADPLLNFIDEQVVLRLKRLDTKIDELAMRMDGGSRQKYTRVRNQDRPVSLPAGCSGICDVRRRFDDGGAGRPAEGDPGRPAGWATTRGVPRPGGLTTLAGMPPKDMLQLKESLPRMPRGEETEFTADAPSPGNFRQRTSTFERKERKDGGAHGRPEEPKDTSAQGGEAEVGHRPSHASTTSHGHQVLDKRAGHLSKWREKTFAFLNDAESSTAAHWFHIVDHGFIYFSILFFAISTAGGSASSMSSDAAAAIEMGIETVFLLEAALRLISSPNRRRFFFNLYNIIDCIAVLPLFLRVAVGCTFPPAGSEGWRLAARNTFICFVPVIRVLKFMRGFERFELLLKAFTLSLEALPVCLYTLLLMTVLFSSIVYLVEPRDNIDTLSTAMWFTIVTMTTVGYGDITPASTAGSMVVSLLVISSVFYMAMPLGMIGQAFTCVWSDRDRILLLKCTRERLAQWGYKSTDIPSLFDMFDRDGNRELELPEFQAMMAEMRIGLSADRVALLFYSFDQDGSGSIDDREFVKALYPADFHRLYEEQDSEEQDRDEADALAE